MADVEVGLASPQRGDARQGFRRGFGSLQITLRRVGGNHRGRVLGLASDPAPQGGVELVEDDRGQGRQDNPFKHDIFRSFGLGPRPYLYRP